MKILSTEEAIKALKEASIAERRIQAKSIPAEAQSIEYMITQKMKVILTKAELDGDDYRHLKALADIKATLKQSR